MLLLQVWIRTHVYNEALNWDFINAYNHPQSAIHCFGFVSARHSEGPRPSESREVNTSWHFTCTKLQTGWSFCNNLCCFIIKSSPRFRCTLAWNPAFSVAPPCRISSLWRPFAMTHYNHLLFINCDHASCLSEATKQYRTAVPASALCVKILIFSTTIRYDTIRCESMFSCVDASPGSGNSLSLMYVAKRDENCIWAAVAQLMDVSQKYTQADRPRQTCSNRPHLCTLCMRRDLINKRIYRVKWICGHDTIAILWV